MLSSSTKIVIVYCPNCIRWTGALSSQSIFVAPAQACGSNTIMSVTVSTVLLIVLSCSVINFCFYTAYFKMFSDVIVIRFILNINGSEQFI